MALAETILRKVHKLGIIPKIIKLIPVLSFLLALSSITWLFVLPYEGFYRNTYISENALMPGQVMSYFRESEWNIVRGYRGEVHDFKDQPINERNAQVESWLKDIGLKTSYHINPNGNNTLYAIMHAPRGDDTESMVLAVPWTTSTGEYNEGGVAIGAGLLRYFSKMSIWSKNIILVFPEDGHASLRSWVEAYHTSLDRTAGSIEAAIVMEYEGESDYFDYYEINYEGLNGQLPNLDLLNTANTVGQHEYLQCSIQSTAADQLLKNTYLTRLRVLFTGILNLGLAGLKKNTPGCEAFSGWQIQAFTLKARGVKGPADVTQFGRIVDSTFRSVNNLLEKFHQSFFFYLMLSPKHFVSIGTYLPSAILLSVAFAISSLGTLLNSGIPIKQSMETLNRLLLIFTIIEIGSFVLSLALPFLTKVSIAEEEAVGFILYGMTFLTITISILPNFDLKIFKRYKLTKSLTYLLISLSLFSIAILIITLLIVHFSLALSIGFFALPLTFIQPIITSANLKKLDQPKHMGTSKSQVNKLISFINQLDLAWIKVSVCLFISSPFFIIYIIGNMFVNDNEGAIIIMRGLLTSWSELQCWTWFIIILGWFPAWLAIGLSCVFGDFRIDHTELNMKKLQ